MPAASLAAGAWVVLAFDHWQDHAALGERWSFGLGSWTLMVIAMMVPGLLAPMRRLSFASLWSRRHRSSAIFAATYVLVWMAFGAAAWFVVSVGQTLTGASFAPGRAAVVLVLLAAAIWQLTPQKQRFLFRCHLERRISPRGRKGDLSLIRYGWFHGRACVGSCGPIMVAMFVGAHDFHLMVPLAAITTLERYQRRPTLAASAAAIATVAALSLIG